MEKRENIIWKFDKKEKFWFLVPEDKKKYPVDFFVAVRNSNNAWNWDLVEGIEILSKGKNKEVRIVKILQKNTWIPAKKYVGDFKKKDFIIWTYSQGKWDFGFVDVEWVEKWYFVFSQNKNWALDGDVVEASIKIIHGKSEATVERVIERKFELIVWEYCPSKTSKNWFVRPQNPLIKTDIFVYRKNTLEASFWDIVVVRIIGWKDKNPEWIIWEILGKKGDKNIEISGLILEGWAKMKFSDEVLKFAEGITTDFSINDSIRKNLTDLFTFTIDGEDAKDLDDAISIEKMQTWWYKLFVHIADVSQYVTENSPLDKEAYKRATSIYLVDRVIPMLPERLSNDLCSLNPDTKKCTLTCEMILWDNGEIQSQKVYESTICSDFRLTYKEVDDLINWKIKANSDLTFWWKVSLSLIQTLQISDELQKKITKYRHESGVLNFNFPETKIILDADGNPLSIEQYPKYDSNTLIEEFMICANEAVSREFSELPFLYRIHEEPKDDDLAKLQDTLNLFWIDFVFKKIDTNEFSKLLEMIQTPAWQEPLSKPRDEGAVMFLEKAILRTLSKAIYSHKSLGHFGLWLQYYSHFTSPIRRYPDLQIHRIIKEKLHGTLDSQRILHYKNILEDVAKHTSDKERRAEKLEYKVRDYFIVQYYKDKVGQEFEGMISWVIAKWFFVVLKDTSEWLVELTKSQYNDDLKEHVDRVTWKKYRLWDALRVKLSSVDETLYRLNFEIL